MLPLRDNIPLSRLPIVTATLIVVNIVTYVLCIRHGGDLFGGPSRETALRYGAIPFELTHAGRECADLKVIVGAHSHSSVICLHDPARLFGPIPSRPPTWQTVFSSIFMHGGFATILADTIALALFGPNVEDATGRLRFLAFYLLGGTVAVAAAVLLAPNSTVPMLAASGAVAAVLGGYARLHRGARVLVLVVIPFLGTIVELPALLFIALWLLAQLCFSATALANPLPGDWALDYAALLVALVFGGALCGPLANAERIAMKRPDTPPRAVY